ncbi:MAG: DNA/RNA non-specific endonuclease [Planctomycetaceae bacterium]
MERDHRRFDDFFQKLQQADPAIGAELQRSISARASLESTMESASGDFTRETIVLTQGRPVLDIRQGAAVIAIQEPESQIWKDRLAGAGQVLAPHIRAVGRIELQNHPRGVDWLGTGWLLRDNVVVTNRHVAEVFAESEGNGFVFRPGLDGTPMRARIDFLEEFDNDSSLEFPLFRVVYVERGSGPDVAFLRIEPVNGQDLPTPIDVSTNAVDAGEQVVVIGYPARDPFFPNPIVMDRIFNHRYDKKRIAPGLVTGANAERVFHDCSTLGGNSGAEVVSLRTGKAVALHFAGTLFTTNHAVPIDVVAQRLDDMLRTRGEGTQPAARASVTLHGTRAVELMIPIKVRVEIGDPLTTQTPSQSGQPARAQIVAPGADHDFVEAVEARAEDYHDRKGYDSDFLGDDFPVPPPQLTENQDDTLTFLFDGETRDVLNYHHFSVLMSVGRRMCRFSACNVDGKDSRRTSRGGWKRDPRIPKTAQILQECYGDPPMFSRGHMTRREDPAWGSPDLADLANRDSMHVTNTVPQMQPFNAGVWLDLEDYALQNAREDDMRICVFTGPFLAENDPIRFGIKVPITFWKVIAFIHDDTGKLCATGYTMSQKSFIGEEEFVFGHHENNQRPISEIERRAGISFGRLAELDPLRDFPESVLQPLTHTIQIRFL